MKQKASHHVRDVMTRTLLLSVALAAPVTVLAQPAPPAPVLVELFTSEGCSSCPPADAFLADLASGRVSAGAEVVPLALHVDYWNRLGWKDPFSSSAFTERQAMYEKMRGIYTPQMVVDGENELVGSNRSRALDVIRAAARAPKTP